MDINIFCFTVLGLLSSSLCQFINIGCPSGWIKFDDDCYKFVHDQEVVFEEADAHCWSTGATLLNVNSFQEHKFISAWLINNDISQSLWYTSAYYTARTVLWEGDNTINHADSQTFWIRQPYTGNDHVFRIVYAYGVVDLVSGFGWMNISGSIPAHFICEIPMTEANQLDVMTRDLDYGLGINDPREVNRGPQITQQPESIVFVKGAVTIEMECFATGNPRPSYTWWKGRGYGNNSRITSEVDTRYTLSGGRLTIQGPRNDDIDDYYCRAENDIGAVLSDKAQVIDGFLEYFSNVEPDPVYATAFKGTTLDCKAPTHSPGVGYEWFKNKATNIFVWPNNGNMFVSQSGLLYFSEVQTTDANKYYYCIVSLVVPDGLKLAKAHAPSRSNLGLMLKLSSDSTSDNNYGPIIHTHAFPSPALQGRKIRLECIAYGTHPLFYSWKREDDRPFVAGTTLSALNRVLTIPAAPLEADGNYVCRVVRGSGASAVKIMSVSIEAKPYFPYPIGDRLLDPGTTINWYCRAVARPGATYTWYKNGHMLSSIQGQVEVNRNVLRIINADKARDEGMYQCAATNQHGVTFSAGQLKVLSFAPNFNRFPLSSLTPAPLGGNITIPCSVEAAPTPEVGWFKNGANMNIMPGDSDDGRVSMARAYGLSITDIQHGDQGTYSCRASNELGKAENTTYVQVIDGIRITKPPQHTRVNVNRTAFIYCQAAFNRMTFDLTYVWKHNGRKIDFELSPEYVLGQQQSTPGLYLTRAQDKNEGWYECQAVTSLHTASKSAFLKVIGPPGPPAGVYADDESITSLSVRLVWTVGTDHGDPVRSYDIEAESHYHPGVWRVIASDIPEHITNSEAVQNDKRSDQRAITVLNLIPNTSYRFRVRAINTYGRGREASKPSASVRIAKTAPIIAPRNVSGGGGKVGTLTIVWDILDEAEHCGPNLIYYVYWKLVGSERDWIKNNATDEMALKEGKFVATIGDENYYRQYQTKVGTHNDEGDGPNSTVQYIYSAMGMPISVPMMQDIETVNSTSVVVYWDPVIDDREHMKGRVAGYRLHYFRDKNGKSSPFLNGEPDSSIIDILVKDVYGQRGSAQLIGLEPYSVYYARVQAFNTAGTGPKGEWRRAETAHFPLRNYPTFVTVYPNNMHSVTVKWRGVSIHNDEESLMGYILRVWKVQEDIRTAKDYTVEKVMETTVTGLQMHTVYELRVLGYSRAGDGALSEAVYFTVLGGSIPFDPATSELCYHHGTTRTCSAASTFHLHVAIFLVTVMPLVERTYTIIHNILL